MQATTVWLNKSEGWINLLHCDVREDGRVFPLRVEILTYDEKSAEGYIRLAAKVPNEVAVFQAVRAT